MTYEEMCRYVAAREGFTDWDAFVKASKVRKENLRFTRQLCMYLGSTCFPKLSYKKLGDVFMKDHATAMHSIQTISFEQYNNRTLAHKISAYVQEITQLIYGDIQKVPPEYNEMVANIMPTIQKMRIIAEAYCEITGKRIV